MRAILSKSMYNNGMKKCVIISDSFKGTLSTFDISRIFEEELRREFPETELLSFPVADGGEGSVDAFDYVLDGETVEIDSVDANLNPIKAKYFISNDGTAYIEVASCIYLASTKEKNPFKTSSFGVGLLIKDALSKGAKRIVLCLGGSATNDMGVGIAKALGAKFINEKGEDFLPTGGTLDEVKKVDLTDLPKFEIVGMCDVTNPLIGEKGASRVYGLQKGASPEEAIVLDEKMSELASLLDMDVSIPGSGAAGGIGGGIIAFFGGTLRKGIDTILEAIDFEKEIQDVDVIFTGEGKFDEQTSNGKVVDGIKRIANKVGVPVVVIAGGATTASEKELDNGIEAIVTTTRLPMEFEKLKPHSEEYYRSALRNALRLIKLGESLK